jgi:hypothetical protein
MEETILMEVIRGNIIIIKLTEIIKHMETITTIMGENNSMANNQFITYHKETQDQQLFKEDAVI